MGLRGSATARAAVTEGKHARSGPGWKAPAVAVILPVWLTIAGLVGGVAVLVRSRSIADLLEGVALIAVGLAAAMWIAWFWLLPSERRQAVRRQVPPEGPKS